MAPHMAGSYLRAFVFILSITACLSSLAPVVLIPGLAGSVMKAKLDGADAPHIWCASHSDWFVTWLNFEQLVPEQKDCLLSRLHLTYDNNTGIFTNAKGVTIDSNVDFGGAGGVAYVDPDIHAAMPYFGPMIDNLTATLGYQIGKNLHGAGYDWRLGPMGHTQATSPGGYFSKLKALIEKTVVANQAKAHLVTHSLGGPTTLAFLNAMEASWIESHVNTFIPLSAPWVGGARMAMTEVGGDNLGEPIPHDYLRPVQQQAESGTFIMPFGAAWEATDPMVVTPSKNYSVAELPDMFQELGLSQTHALYAQGMSKGLLAGQLKPPTIPTHVIYSNGIKTPYRFVYKKDFGTDYDAAPDKSINGDGDGTVNLLSLEWAQHNWSSNVNATYFMIPNLIHANTVKDPRAFAKIIDIITS